MLIPLSESCRLVQGSKQDSIYITSEPRTEQKVSRLRRFAPDNALTSAGENRNKSGTAEVICAFVSYLRQRRFL